MMGITIEDSIKYFTAMRNTYQVDSEQLSIAIETMRKYLKIQKIINEYDTAWELHHMKSTIDKIREVIKNENDKYCPNCGCRMVEPQEGANE